MAGKLASLSRNCHLRGYAVCNLHDDTVDLRVPELIMCSKCGQNLSSECYPAKHVQRLLEQGLLQSDAACYECERRELTKLEGKILQCALCGVEQDRRAFTLTMQKRAATSRGGLRCKDCQMPACSLCGLRSQAPLPPRSAPKSLKEKDNYMCFQCAFPRCKDCRKEMTKQQRWCFKKGEAGNAQEWTCTDCIDIAHNRRYR